MTNNKLTLETYNPICEAVGCSEYATEKIDVNAGKFGKITLNLCNNCVPKFNINSINKNGPKYRK